MSFAEADFTGSAAKMINWVKSNRRNVAAETPEVDFVRPCNLCPHMKRIQLPKILDSLLYMKEEVFIDPLIAARAALGGVDGES